MARFMTWLRRLFLLVGTAAGVGLIAIAWKIAAEGGDPAAAVYAAAVGAIVLLFVLTTTVLLTHPPGGSPGVRL